jgi:hypothetical protein
VYVDPSILKVNPVKEDVTVMVPEAKEHVGCVIVAIGLVGLVLMIKLVAVLQPGL